MADLASPRIRSSPMDHDRLFKELLTTFFVDFLEVFCPELAMLTSRTWRYFRSGFGWCN
jgi:hypothetical protein